MSAVVYRIYDGAGRLIYIGATSNLEQRLAAHRSQAPWWSLLARVVEEPHADMESAHDAEWAAIAAERPVFNVALRRGRPTSRPHRLSPQDAQLCRDWHRAKNGRGYLPMPLQWVLEPEPAH